MDMEVLEWHQSPIFNWFVPRFIMKDWLLDINAMTNRQGLFKTQRLGNRVYLGRVCLQWKPSLQDNAASVWSELSKRLIVYNFWNDSDLKLHSETVEEYFVKGCEVTNYCRITDTWSKVFSTFWFNSRYMKWPFPYPHHAQSHCLTGHVTWFFMGVPLI